MMNKKRSGESPERFFHKKTRGAESLAGKGCGIKDMSCSGRGRMDLPRTN